MNQYKIYYRYGTYSDTEVVFADDEGAAITQSAEVVRVEEGVTP